MKWLTEDKDGCTIILRVIPRASRSEFAGMEEDWVRLRLKAAPVDGKANAELIKFLARTFQVSKAAVTILSGDTARLKRVKLAGISATTLHKQLPKD